MSQSVKFDRVIIAEKPSLARSIAEVLGVRGRPNGFIDCGKDAVTWCVGHMLEMAPPEAYGEQHKRWRLDTLPIVPERWLLIPKPDLKAQIDVVRKLLANAKEVVNAGDPDREGQLLVDELLEHLRCRLPVKRVWLQDLTPDGIARAMAALKPNTQYARLRDSALARARADWLIGMNMTRAYTVLWQQAGGDSVLHIGRVQTPTLGLVVARDREIESFVPKDYYVGLVRLKHANGEFVARWQPPEDADWLDEAGRVLDRKAVEAMLARVAGGSGEIIKLKTERKREAPPLPYTLADLQKDAHKTLGLSPQQTLDGAQALYETHKLATYPRTDCPYLPGNEHANAATVLAAVRANLGQDYGGLCATAPDLKRRSAAWDDTKLGAHHGIIPTAHKVQMSALSKDERGLYNLIVRRYLAQFFADYQYDSTTLTAGIGKDRFTAQGKAVVEMGWRSLFPASSQDKEGKEADAWSLANPLPPGMREKDPVRMVDGTVRAEKTQPPPRFDGASLIEAMQKAHLYVKDKAMRAKLKETQGIGTEATRAGIIQALVNRGYLLTRKKARGKGDEFISSDKGRALIDMVDAKLSEVDLTAWFEGQLDGVLEGRVPLDAVGAEMRRFVEALIASARSSFKPVNAASSSSQTCPACGRQMVLRNGKNGRFWGCRGYPECRQTLPYTAQTTQSQPPKAAIKPAARQRQKGRRRRSAGGK